MDSTIMLRKFIYLKLFIKNMSSADVILSLRTSDDLLSNLALLCEVRWDVLKDLKKALTRDQR
jgi:hypothetical protein